MSSPTGLLLLSHLRVQNANAISGPFSWGFPSPTAFLGFVHALELQLTDHLEIAFGGVGIVCHHFSPQVFKPSGQQDQVFCLARNPTFASWKKFENKQSPIVEEGRAHLDISLIVEVLTEQDDDEQELLAEVLMEKVNSMRLAGGSIVPQVRNSMKPEWFELADDEDDNSKIFCGLRRRLFPGFALVHRPDLLSKRLKNMRKANPQSNSFDALLDFSRINFESSTPNPEKEDEFLWTIRRNPGWLVPIPIGYAGISPLHPPGKVANVRDQSLPFRFVESVYSLGQWISPHRLQHPNEIIWKQEADLETGIYLCVNGFARSQSTE